MENIARLFLIILGSSVVPTGELVSQQLDTLATIGEVFGAPEYTFGTVAEAAIGPDNRIFVLDAGAAAVRVYNFDGSHVTSFGRHGDGPGEFRAPTQMVVTDSTVRVFDAKLHRTVTFTVDGQHLSTSNFPPRPTGVDFILPLRDGYHFGARMATVTATGIESLANATRATLEVENRRFRERNSTVAGLLRDDGSMDTIASYDNGWIFYVAGSPATRFGPLGRNWGVGGVFSVSGDSLIATVDGYTGVVRFLAVVPDGIQLIRRGQLSISAMPVSEMDWRKVADSVRLRRDLPTDIRLTGPPLVGQVTDCFFDDSGSLWVRKVGTEGARYIVIPSDERPQRTVAMPSNVSLYDVRGHVAVAGARSELGTQVIHILRMSGY
jgi:hypothetical protein